MESKPTMDYDTLRGSAEFKDSVGQAWGIRVFTLGSISRFFRLLSILLSTDSAPLAVLFYAACLRAPKPGIKVRLRRLLGMNDFSRRTLMKALPWRDMKDLRDAIMMANLGMSFSDFVEKEAPRLKKKTAHERTTGSQQQCTSESDGD